MNRFSGVCHTVWQVQHTVYVCISCVALHMAISWSRTGGMS
jgi:hypothetical protein